MRVSLLAVATLIVLAGCDDYNADVAAQGIPEVAQARCNDVLAKRGQVQVGMRWSDVRQLLGQPDYQNSGIGGVTSNIYNATCGSYAKQVLVKVQQDAVIGVYYHGMEDDPSPTPRP